MDSGLIMYSPGARSHATGGNLWQSKHPTKNSSYASFSTSKASYHRKTQAKSNILRFQQPSSNYYYKCLEGWPTHQECNQKCVVKANPKPPFSFESPADYVKNFVDIFYTLCYPYAMIGIIICTISSSFLAVEKLSDISLSLFTSVLQVVVTHFFVAIYVFAINQLFDSQIDKINKPYLPLAAGKLSLTTIIIIAASSLTLSLGLSWKIGSWPLIWNIVLTASIWSIYSFNVPLLRWKRHPLLAAICIILSGGFILPITFFLHMQTFVLKRPIVFSRSLITVVLFMSFYYMGIALSKDIPDVEGDKAYGVDTFAIRLGQKRVFWISIFIFEIAFGIAFLAGISSPYLWIKIVTGFGNIVLALILWYQAKSLDLSNKSATRSFFMLIWKLLNGAYFFTALIR